MAQYDTCRVLEFVGGDAAQLVLSERILRATRGTSCVCRFCLCKEEHEVHQKEQLDDLVSPCACRGCVHIGCFLQDFKDRGDWHNFKCPSCGRFYEGNGLHCLAQLFVAQMTEQHGEESLQVARSLGVLAQGLSQIGKVKEATKLLELSLEIKERHFGKNHPAVATTLTELANACRLLGDKNYQNKLLERSLAIKQKQCGVRRLSTSSQLNMAAAWIESGDVVQAREMLERCLAIEI